MTPVKEKLRESKFLSLHCALSLAAQCIVIGPVCDSVVCNGRAGRRAVSDSVLTTANACAVYASL